MSTAVTFITYLWHYLVARMLYDQIVRPLSHGHLSSVLLLAAVAAAAFGTGRWSGRRTQRTEGRRRRP